MNLKRGFQQIADFLNFLLWAIEANNLPAVAKAKVVAKKWLSEGTDLKGSIRLTNWSLLFSDPFAGSRELLRELLAEFPQDEKTRSASAMTPRPVDANQ